MGPTEELPKLKWYLRRGRPPALALFGSSGTGGASGTPRRQVAGTCPSDHTRILKLAEEWKDESELFAALCRCDGWWEEQGYGRQPMENLRISFGQGRLQGSGSDIVGPFTLSG